MVYYGLWGKGGGFVGLAAAAFTGDAAEVVSTLPLVVASGVELLECWEVVIRVGDDLCRFGWVCLPAFCLICIDRPHARRAD